MNLNESHFRLALGMTEECLNGMMFLILELRNVCGVATF